MCVQSLVKMIYKKSKERFKKGGGRLLTITVRSRSLKANADSTDSAAVEDGGGGFFLPPAFACERMGKQKVCALFVCVCARARMTRTYVRV